MTGSGKTCALGPDPCVADPIVPLSEGRAALALGQAASVDDPGLELAALLLMCPGRELAALQDETLLSVLSRIEPFTLLGVDATKLAIVVFLEDI